MTRFGFDRIVFLAQFVRERKEFTLDELEQCMRGRRLAVCRRVVRNDFDLLRKSHGYLIQYDWEKRRWRAQVPSTGRIVI